MLLKARFSTAFNFFIDCLATKYKIIAAMYQLVIEKVAVNTLPTKSVVGNLGMRSRVDKLNAVDGTAFRHTAFLQRMTQIDGWFNVDVLSVAQSTKCRLPVCFRLLENIFFWMEEVVRVIVVTA